MAHETETAVLDRLTTDSCTGAEGAGKEGGRSMKRKQTSKSVAALADNLSVYDVFIYL